MLLQQNSLITSKLSFQDLKDIAKKYCTEIFSNSMMGSLLTASIHTIKLDYLWTNYITGTSLNNQGKTD